MAACASATHPSFATANLLRNGGGGGRGVASVSTGAGRSSADPGAPSILYGAGGVASTATGSAATAELTRLTARLPNARASGVSATASEGATSGPRSASSPLPGGVELLTDAPGATSSTSGRWSRGPRPTSPLSFLSEASVDNDVDEDSSNGRPSFRC
ncbi:predicted GPI-anchored protein 23 [Miscanthus floridulus]|uniref:predicted GPI-anchored protein 23 n=1 Tax=Miscanthus floridulus TaxID=154761 RepID=UPI0034585494